MFASVMKSLFIIATLAMACVGVVSSAAIVALALGTISMEQLIGAIQGVLDNSEYYLYSYGGANVVAALRAIKPHIVGYVRNWLIDVVRNEISRGN